jgi:hypothetical protein
VRGRCKELRVFEPDKAARDFRAERTLVREQRKSSANAVRLKKTDSARSMPALT